MISRPIIIVTLVFCLLCAGLETAAAEHRKKLAVAALENPPGWKGSYDPGSLFSALLRRSLARDNKFQLVPHTPIHRRKEGSRGMKKGAKSGNHPKSESRAPDEAMRDKMMLEGGQKEGSGSQAAKPPGKPNDKRKPSKLQPEAMKKESAEPKMAPKTEMKMKAEAKEGLMEKEELEIPPGELLKAEAPSPPRHPAQFIVMGKINRFLPNEADVVQALRREFGEIEGAFQEVADIELELHIVNRINGRSLKSEVLRFSGGRGKIPFLLDGAPRKIDDPAFSDASMGQALNALARKAEDLVTRRLLYMPLEAEIIAVDEENEEVILNVGRINGVQIGEKFRAFKVTLGFTDPLNQTDLGDKYLHLGVIQIKHVQERFSLAHILAGENFQKGILVRPRDNPDITVDEETGEVTEFLPWWIFRGGLYAPQ